MEADDPKAWVCYSDRDVKSARLLFEAGDFAPVMFFLQQGIEKRLKAILVMNTGQEPPRVHNLLHLAELLNLELSEEAEGLLFDLTQLYITTRYPGFQLPQDLLEDPEQAGDLLRRAEEVIEWLDQSLTPSESPNEQCEKREDTSQ